jgi:hypothetical protein
MVHIMSANLMDSRHQPVFRKSGASSDEASWAMVEIPEFQTDILGGTVNACDVYTWICTEVATGLPIPIEPISDRRGAVYPAINALIPGSADVIQLP